MARKPKHTAYSLENGRSYAELRTFTRTVTAQGSLTDAEENPNAIALGIETGQSHLGIW